MAAGPLRHRNGFPITEAQKACNYLLSLFRWNFGILVALVRVGTHFQIECQAREGCVLALRSRQKIP